jgi:hypothetical protein
MDPPKADLNHDLDNNQKQTANQADMPGKPMQLKDADKKHAPGDGDPKKKQDAKGNGNKPAPSERDTGKKHDPKEVSSHAEKPKHSGKEGNSRT